MKAIDRSLDNDSNLSLINSKNDINKDIVKNFNFIFTANDVVLEIKEDIFPLNINNVYRLIHTKKETKSDDYVKKIKQ